MSYDKFLINIKNLFNIYNFLLLIFILFLFIIDRFSKVKVIANFDESSYYINKYLNLDLTWNTGIGCGLFASNSDFLYNFISSVIGAVIVFLIYWSFKSDKYEKFFFSLIIGGALGNFYDRITFKAVPDFIDVHYNNFHWFTFNIADIFITLGVIAFLAKGLFDKKNL